MPKLSFRFYGRFVITKTIGKVTYQLDLPKSWWTHNIFHVSLLKKNVSYPFHVFPKLFQTLNERNTLVEHEQILKIEVC